MTPKETQRLLQLAAARAIVARDVETSLGVSRATAQRMLHALVESRRLVRRGAGRATEYAIAPMKLRWRRAGLAEDKAWKEIEPEVAVVTAHAPVTGEALKTVNYCVSEMLNNAIEHSDARFVAMRLAVDRNELVIEIRDDGIGVFENVKQTHHLESLDDAIVQLEKGKLTSQPKGHTGQGLFFTSKAACRFRLESDSRAWIVDNVVNDRSIGQVAPPIRGTRVEMRFPLMGTIPTLEQVFGPWAPPEGDFAKTRVTVKLAAHSNTLMSRSEARRVVAGLDKFAHVILDFAGVETIGQGFADEVFRVFADAHAAIALEPINMSASVAAMVHRATPNSLERKIEHFASASTRFRRASARVRAASSMATPDDDAALLAVTALLAVLGVSDDDVSAKLSELLETTVAKEAAAIAKRIPALLHLEGPGVSSESARRLDRAAGLVLERIAERRDLWPHFHDDAAVARFWSLAAEDRRRIWGARLELA